jgi:hypothetical protein
LRLNGFFLLDNFVIHKSVGIKYSSDADLLALRQPFVFEQVGGQPEDWADCLFDSFNTPVAIAIICQVKGGKIGDKPLFEEPYLSYSIRRFGITKNIAPIIDQLKESPIATITNELGQEWQIAKLLITKNEPPDDPNYLFIKLDAAYKFISERIEKYPKEKYRDRNFFSSIVFQVLIEMANMKEKKIDH